MAETQIQSGIIDYLQRKRHFFVRLNNIPPVQYIGGKMVFRRMPKGTMLGLPDILVLWKGYPVFIEVKALKGKQSKEQKEFEEKCKDQSIEYHVVRSLTDVLEIGL
jgi:hypothetical protein